MLHQLHGLAAQKRNYVPALREIVVGLKTLVLLKRLNALFERT
jgi:hypothetical protein